MNYDIAENSFISTFDRKTFTETLTKTIDLFQCMNLQVEIQYKPVYIGDTMNYTALLIGRKKI